MLKIYKGGPGSGNWGHVGRPGKLGGSQSNKFAMSIASGKTAAERQAAARAGKGGQSTNAIQPGTPGENATYAHITSGDDKIEDMLNEGLIGNDYLHTPVPWNEAEIVARSVTKNQIVSDVHARIPPDLDIQKDDVNQTLQTWASSSNDNDPKALSLQQAASEEFGIPLSQWQQGKVATAQANVHYAGQTSVNGMSRPQERAVLRAIYDNTQEKLAAAGYKPTDTIQLFRGIEVRNAADDGYVALPRGVANYTGNAMESWSSSSSVASSFSVFQARNVLSQSVPVKNIISTCRTGLGCLVEAEFVVMGVPGTQVLITDIGHAKNVYTQ